MEKEDMLKYIENLEEENKRLRKANENTIKINVFYKEANYEVDTQIKQEFIEGKDYYIADDYKEPTKIKFMGYNVNMSIENHYIILAEVYNYWTAELETISFKRLCLTKDKASNLYLEMKNKINAIREYKTKIDNKQINKLSKKYELKGE